MQRTAHTQHPTAAIAACATQQKFLPNTCSGGGSNVFAANEAGLSPRLAAVAEQQQVANGRPTPLHVEHTAAVLLDPCTLLARSSSGLGSGGNSSSSSSSSSSSRRPSRSQDGWSNDGGASGALPAAANEIAASVEADVAASGLAGFVALPAYQAQIQAVAQLHSQVGTLAVQLREATANADGATALLQQERREAETHAGSLRGKLAEARAALCELAAEHEELRRDHAALVARDLSASGLLRDKCAGAAGALALSAAEHPLSALVCHIVHRSRRSPVSPAPLVPLLRYLSDLFQRLQRAEWALATARRRAATWGFEMMVPLGRADRGIQTHPAEVWASEHHSAAPGTARGSAGERPKLPALAPAGRGPRPGLTSPGSAEPDQGGGGGSSGGGGAVELAETMSATTLRSALSELPGLGCVGTRDRAEASDTGFGGRMAAADRVVRAHPAFAAHAAAGGQPARPGAAPSGKVGNNNQLGSRSTSPGPLQMRDGSAGAGASGSAGAASVVEWRALVAARLLAAEAAAQVDQGEPLDECVADQQAACEVLPPVLSARALLSLVAELLGAKAQRDAAALAARRLERAGSASGDDLAAFVLAHMARGITQAAATSPARSSPGEGAHDRLWKSVGAIPQHLFNALVQLVASVRLHAPAVKEVALFGKALGCLGPLKELAAAATAGSGGVSSGTGSQQRGSEPAAAGTDVMQAGAMMQQPARSLRRRRARFTALPPEALVPHDIRDALAALVAWPGMGAVLSWVSSAAFLGHMRGSGDVLGRPLLDVQVKSLGPSGRGCTGPAGAWGHVLSAQP